MTCPTCGSPRVYLSRLRGPLERIHELLTSHQPYRCHGCGWRGWREVRVLPESPDVRAEDLRTGRASNPLTEHDLDELDTTPTR
jgi:hypothetical protein